MFEELHTMEKVYIYDVECPEGVHNDFTIIVTVPRKSADQVTSVQRPSKYLGKATIFIN